MSSKRSAIRKESESTRIIDPEARTFEIFERLDSGRYVLAAHGASGILHPLSGFDLTLDLDALWAEIDELPEAEVE